MKLINRQHRRGSACLLLLLAALNLPLHAQQGFSAYDIATKSNSYYPPSVNAARLFQKPAEAMDYARGRATVRIPLYEIRTKDFTLPISLCYTTGGIPANQPNGNVAIGWQLEAEPMVTRMVRGMPDEVYYLSSGSEADSDNPSAYFRKCVAAGVADIQRDIFCYRLLSGGGKFTLKPSDKMAFQPEVLSKEGVKVHPIAKISTDFSNPITITDAKGNRYTFGGSYSALEKTSQTGTANCFTSWKASEIVSPDGDKISFSYTSAPSESHSSRYDFYMLEDQFPKNFNTPSSVPPHPGYWEGVNGKMNYYYVGSYGQRPDGKMYPIFKQWNVVTNKTYEQPASSVDPRPVSRITFDGGHVQFTYGSEEMLQEVAVYRGGTLEKRISLSRSQTVNASRYFLDAVRMHDANGASAGSYTFGYFAGVNHPKDYTGIDYWGYYNGRRYDDLVPFQDASFFDNVNNPALNIAIGTASRDGNLQESQAFSLRTVTYPSGGKTEFEYESNRCYLPGSTDDSPLSTTAGGVRLKSVTDYPLNGKNVKRSFKYGKDASLKDIGYSAFPVCPKSFGKTFQKHYLMQGPLGQIVNYSGRMQLFSSQNFANPDCSVYYPCVREEVDGAYTLHYFSNLNTPECGSEESYPIVAGYDTKRTWEQSYTCLRYGQPVETKSFSIRELGNSLREVKPLATFENGLNPYDAMPVSIEELYLGSYTTRSVHVFDKDPGITESVTEKSDGQNAYKETEKRTYVDFQGSRRLRSVEKGNGPGMEKVEFYYPQDFPAEEVCALMVAANELETPVETKHYAGGVLRKRIRYNFVKDAATTRGYRLAEITESTDAAGNTMRVAESYGSVSPCGKPGEVTRADGTKACLVWAYNGRHLIASIEGMSAAQVKAAGVDLTAISKNTSPAESVYTPIENLRAAYPEARVSTYRYLPTGRLKQRTDPDGVKEAYQYDGSGRLSKIQDNQLKTISTYEYHEANL